MFPIVAVPAFIPTSSAQGFPFLHILSHTCPLSFDTSHSNRCEVIFHGAFDLHFSDDW